MANVSEAPVGSDPAERVILPADPEVVAVTVTTLVVEVAVTPTMELEAFMAVVIAIATFVADVLVGCDGVVTVNPLTTTL